MPRRKSLPAPPEDPTALHRSNLSREFEEAIDLYGDPRLKLLSLAEKAERDDDLSTAVRALSEVAQYVAPKLRALEVQANVQSTSVIFNSQHSSDPEEPHTENPDPKKRSHLPCCPFSCTLHSARRTPPVRCW